VFLFGQLDLSGGKDEDDTRYSKNDQVEVMDSIKGFTKQKDMTTQEWEKRKRQWKRGIVTNVSKNEGAKGEPVIRLGASGEDGSNRKSIESNPLRRGDEITETPVASALSDADASGEGDFPPLAAPAPTGTDLEGGDGDGEGDGGDDDDEGEDVRARTWHAVRHYYKPRSAFSKEDMDDEETEMKRNPLHIPPWDVQVRRAKGASWVRGEVVSSWNGDGRTDGTVRVKLVDAASGEIGRFMKGEKVVENTTQAEGRVVERVVDPDGSNSEDRYKVDLLSARAKCDKIFEKFDEDKSNSMDFRELQALLATLWVPEVGTRARVRDNLSLDEAKELQKGHGGWGADMAEMMGKDGEVTNIDSDGDIVVHGKCWNPALLAAAQNQEAMTRGQFEELCARVNCSAEDGLNDNGFYEYYAVKYKEKRGQHILKHFKKFAAGYPDANELGLKDGDWTKVVRAADLDIVDEKEQGLGIQSSVKQLSTDRLGIVKERVEEPHQYKVQFLNSDHGADGEPEWVPFHDLEYQPGEFSEDGKVPALLEGQLVTVKSDESPRNGEKGTVKEGPLDSDEYKVAFSSESGYVKSNGLVAQASDDGDGEGDGGGSGAKLFSAHDRVRNVEADHRVGAVVGESSVNAGHYTVEYDDGGREADVDGGSLRLEAFQIGQRVVLVRTDDQVPEAEAVGTVLKLDMDSAEAQQDGNGGGGGGVVRPGDTVTFTVSSDNANFDGCPGSTLAFSVGSEYTVKEVQGGFFLTTTYNTLWAPVSAIDVSAQAVEISPTGRAEVVFPTGTFSYAPSQLRAERRDPDAKAIGDFVAMEDGRRGRICAGPDSSGRFKVAISTQTGYVKAAGLSKGSAGGTDAPTTMNCPGGHGLKQFTAQSNGYTCDVCLTSVGEGDAVLGCRPCNFDTCQDCYTIRSVTCPNGHKLEHQNSTSSDGWGCDGRREDGGCAHPGGDYWGRFRCHACDLDYCHGCFVKKHGGTLPVMCPNMHPLKNMGTTTSDGWGCDGRREDGGCSHPGGDYWGRYRCQTCDWDYCHGCLARHGGSPDDYIKKGDAVTVLETGRTGVVTYGPDSDGDYKVTHTDETDFTDADALTKGDVLAKGGRVFHLEKKRAGIITYGPDSDGDYKVTFDDDQSESGYTKAGGLRAESLRLGEWVSWNTSDEDVPEGAKGQVIGLKEEEDIDTLAQGEGSARIYVRFPKGVYIFNTRSMRTATPPVAAETAAAFKQGDRVHHVDEDLDGVICYGPDSDGDYKVRFEKVEIFPRDALTTDGSGGGGDDGEDGDGDKDDEDDDTPKKRFDNYGWSEKGYNNGSLNIQPWRPPGVRIPVLRTSLEKGDGCCGVRVAWKRFEPPIERFDQFIIGLLGACQVMNIVAFYTTLTGCKSVR
jgi:hypothetical protein